MKGYTYSVCIRAFCLDCMGFSAQLVSKCPSKSCLFYPFRFVKRPYPRPRLLRLQAIRLKCLECVGSPEEVNKCSNLDCPIHVYRNREIPSPKSKKIQISSDIPSKFSPNPKQLSLIWPVTNDLLKVIVRHVLKPVSLATPCFTLSPTIFNITVLR